MTLIKLINADFFLSASISIISVLQSNQRAIKNSIGVLLLLNIVCAEQELHTSQRITQ